MAAWRQEHDSLVETAPLLAEDRAGSKPPASFLDDPFDAYFGEGLHEFD
jgi:hypothetical protein